jgi:two-component system response regulator YesN
MIEQTKPDVLLLDLIIQGIYGLEVLKKIYEAGVIMQIYIISAVKNEEIKEIAIKYGVQRYFIKPIDINEILSAVLESYAI